MPKNEFIELLGVPLLTLLLVNFLVGVGFQESFSLAAFADELIFSSSSLIIDFELSFRGVLALWNGFRRVIVIGSADGVIQLTSAIDGIVVSTGCVSDSKTMSFDGSMAVDLNVADALLSASKSI